MYLEVDELSVPPTKAASIKKTSTPTEEEDEYKPAILQFCSSTYHWPDLVSSSITAALSNKVWKLRSKKRNWRSGEEAFEKARRIPQSL